MKRSLINSRLRPEAFLGENKGNARGKLTKNRNNMLKFGPFQRHGGRTMKNSKIVPHKEWLKQRAAFLIVDMNCARPRR
jgi:hypothetical protein